MAKHKQLPALTPRGVQVINLVVNSVALGSHDNDAEVGAIAQQIGMSPPRLQSLLRKLQEQGWLTVKHGFVYPTHVALHWQNPDLTDKAAAKIIRALK